MGPQQQHYHMQGCNFGGSQNMEIGKRTGIKQWPYKQNICVAMYKFKPEGHMIQIQSRPAVLALAL